ncbi:MAG: class I SAM-dependent methyltransferase [Solirubrobacteraceae bacterium]
MGWAREQLERLELRGDEVVLDAGCGSGRVTELLLERSPRGRVYAVDAAPSMVEHTRVRLGDRVTVLCQDLAELSLPEPVEVIFSNATFHWVPDHDALFAALRRNLSQGGRLMAQCGGQGNIEVFRAQSDEVAGEAPFAEHFEGWQRPWIFATAPETAQRLEEAGFTEVDAWLEPRSVTLADAAAFIRSVCLVRHLDRLPRDLRQPFVERILQRTGEPLVLDYVRLNMTARNPD